LATKQQQRTSLQTRGGRAAYYSSPTTQTVTVNGHMAGRQGGVYRYQTPGGQRIAGKPPVPAKTWHRGVLAEFVATVLLIGIAPVLTPRPGASDAQAAEGVAVSLSGPLVRLTAACVVFFVLALMATGERPGKVAAAFGFLVMLGAGLNATDELAALARTFSGGLLDPGASGGTS
jgi:hypothetical protein